MENLPNDPSFRDPQCQCSTTRYCQERGPLSVQPYPHCKASRTKTGMGTVLVRKGQSIKVQPRSKYESSVFGIEESNSEYLVDVVCSISNSHSLNERERKIPNYVGITLIW